MKDESSVVLVEEKDVGSEESVEKATAAISVVPALSWTLSLSTSSNGHGGTSG